MATAVAHIFRHLQIFFATREIAPTQAGRSLGWGWERLCRRSELCGLSLECLGLSLELGGIGLQN